MQGNGLQDFCCMRCERFWKVAGCFDLRTCIGLNDYEEMQPRLVYMLRTYCLFIFLRGSSSSCYPALGALNGSLLAFFSQSFTSFKLPFTYIFKQIKVFH